MKKVVKAIISNNEVVGTEIKYTLFGITLYTKTLLLPPKHIKYYEFNYRF